MTRLCPAYVLILVMCVVVGASFLIGSPTPTSIETQIPYAWRYVLYLLLTIGGGTTLAAILKPTITGHLIERIGLISLAIATACYAAAIFGFAGWRGLGAGAPWAAFAAMTLWRIWQIGQTLTKLTKP